MPQERKNPNCLICGSVNAARKKICSVECKLIWTRQKQGYKGTARPAPIAPCKHCHAEFKPRSQKGRRFDYCSHECLWASQRQSKAIADKAEANRLAVVMPEIQALRRIARYIVRPRMWIDGCSCCSKSMVVRFTKGGRKRVCDECIKATQTKLKRIAKARRRARMLGARHEAIDPIKVFQDADWICYLCDRKTVKALRGTYEPLAPELEHIIPLSKGGTHTYDNVACACRECNQYKSDNVLIINANTG